MQNEYYITQIFVFFSLVPVLKKLPDHQNLPFLMTCFKFGTSHEYLYSYIGIFRQSQSSGKNVILAALLAWNPGQALSWNPRHAQHQR